MAAQEKEIVIHLYDGTLQGMIRAKESGRDPGVMFVIPLDKLEHIKGVVADKIGCVYILLSSKCMHIGQSKSLSATLAKQPAGANPWQRMVVVSTLDDSLSQLDLDYLEATLIARAHMANVLRCTNALKNPPGEIGAQKRTYLDEYINTAVLLMSLLGISCFAGKGRQAETKPNTASASCQPDGIRQRSGERLRKSEAMDFVRNHGIRLSENTSFATLQKDRPVFWVNPRVSLLNTDWHLVLNDNHNYRLIVLHVPAGSIRQRRGQSEGVICRADKPELVDLQIDLDTLVDQRSRTSFSRFLVTKIPY